MNIPNIITLARIILVPVIVWAIASNQMEIAFAVFVIAGVSDAVDGFLAKRFNMTSELGALLDPLADKALLVSIFVALGIWGAVLLTILRLIQGIGVGGEWGGAVLLAILALLGGSASSNVTPCGSRATHSLNREIR